MKLLYLDCGMGAAGDMMAAALLELLDHQEEFLEEVNALGIPGVHIKKEATEKCGIQGTHIRVTVDGKEEESHDHSHEHHHSHEHSHHSLHDIGHLVEGLQLSPQVKEDIMAVYGLIAEAESAVHGKPVDQIHFHEVGNLDAVADIAMVCMLMEKLKIQKVAASPVHTGSGQVRCAHGILPVPAPATAYILRGIPVYSGHIRGELCTPTGAALLKYFAHSFGPMPAMRMERIGYGMGKKDFEAANCIRAMLGETAEADAQTVYAAHTQQAGNTEEVLELCCNVDDMTAEEMGFAMERLLEAGALDVYTVPVGMKKSRPGTVIHILCREQDREVLIGAALRHTTTIGIRESRFTRYALSRNTEVIRTPYGQVRCKVSSGYGVRRSKLEYEDLADMARKENISLREAKERVHAHFRLLTEQQGAEEGEIY